MARVVNEKNEVIARKDENNKRVGKQPISKTGLIVGVVLFIIALVITIVLIAYFTGKKDSAKEDIPTLLECYIDDYNRKYTGPKEDVQIIEIGGNLEKIRDYYGECYILIYDRTWNINTEVGTDEYDYYLNIDEWLIGSGKTSSGAAKTSTLDALIESGSDIVMFIQDYSIIAVDDDSDKKATITLNTGKTLEVDSPMLIHMDDQYDDGFEPIVTGFGKIDDWSRALQELATTFKKLEDKE